MQIFFDFDGTLLDSQPRLYKLFCDMCPENHFSYEEYCNIKRQRVTQAEMLARYFQYPEAKITEFHRQWLAEVENPLRMQEDQPYDGIDDLLHDLSSRHELYIITNRQSKVKTMAQIEQQHWENLLQDVLVTEQKSSKIELAKTVLQDSARALWVGDTGEDMKAAHALNIPVIAVSWGVIAPELLADYKPDALAADVVELRECMKKFLR